MIIVCLVQIVPSCLNVLLIVLHLYFCYSGINAGEVARRVSGGECDGVGVPTAISPSCLVTVTGLGY